MCMLKTLRQVQGCGLPASEFETLVVDNASSDGTDTKRSRATFPRVRRDPELDHQSGAGREELRAEAGVG